MVAQVKWNCRDIATSSYPRSLIRTRIAVALKAALFVFFAALAFAAPGRAAEDGPYPVWWSAALELDSLDQVETRLRLALWPHFPEGLKLYKGQGAAQMTAQARNCNSLIRLTEEGYYGGGSPDIFVQNYQLSVCQAVDLFSHARPTRVSYLRDFVLNKDAVNHLPAMVNIYAACSFVCRAFYANRRGVPLAKFVEIERLKVSDKNRLIVWTVGWRIEMTLVARGDFTSDGLDDILLMSSGGATKGTMGGAELYLLTRDEPDAVLRVIDPEKHLCPDYTGCG